LTSPIKISNRWIWSYKSLTIDSIPDWENYTNGYTKQQGLIDVAEGFTMKGTGGKAEIDVTKLCVLLVNLTQQ
jgi:hypothetical protein